MKLRSTILTACFCLQATVSHAAETDHTTDASITIMFACILAAMILCLAMEEKLHAKKSLITGCFAIVSLLAGAALDLLPFGPVLNVFGESIRIPVYIPAVDWEVIAIIVGASIFVDVTSKSGLFSWIAIKLTKTSAGDPFKLLIFYGVMTVLFSAVLNNVTAMIIIGSLTGVSLNKLGHNDKLLGFLLIEGLLTNVGGLLTLISSVPNIIVGNLAGIAFIDFFLYSAPYVFIASALTLWLGASLFGIRRLTTETEKVEAAQQVSSFDENDGIAGKAVFRYSIVLFVLLILAFSLQSVIPLLDELGMGFVALMFAFIALLRFRNDVNEFYANIDWDLIFFFVTLFMVINVMEHARVLEAIGVGIVMLTELGPKAGPLALLWSSAVASSVTDNIPLAAMLGKILFQLGEQTTAAHWWSVIFGSNLGGNITPIGSASTVVAVTVLHKFGIRLSFLEFVSKAFIFAFAQLILATGYILVMSS